MWPLCQSERPLFHLSVLVLTALVLAVAPSGGELGGREGDSAEHFARVFRAAGVVAAFLGGDAVVHHGNDQLGIPLQPDDGKLAQGNEKPSAVRADVQLFVKHSAYAVRHLNGCGFLAAAIAGVTYPGTEDHGIQHFHHGGGAIGVAPGHTVGTVEAGVASVDVGAAVLAAQNCPFAENGQAVQGCGTGGSDNGIGDDPVVKGDIDAVVVPVKSHRFHASLLRCENRKGRICISVDTEILNNTTGIIPTNTIILDYIKEKYGFNVHTLYLAQVRAKYGIQVHESYGQKGDCKRNPSVCPKYKEEAIIDAFRHFNLID